MRLHFGETPWDLYAAIGYTAIMAVLLLVFEAGNLVAILLVLFVPGYVLVALLFPGQVDIDWIERFALSVGLSVAIVPLLGLLLNFTSWGISFAPIVVTLTCFTLGVGLAACWRRLRLPPHDRLSATINLAIPLWKEYSLLDKCLTIALAGSVVAAGGTLAYAVLTPGPRETFTEFYILGPGGNASGYPTALNVSQSGTVILGIANHESANIGYTVLVDLVGVRIVYNATQGFNETVEVNRTTWSSFNVTLADGRNWTQPYTFQINYRALWKVQFLLFKETGFASAYRELHLYVRVS